METFRLEAIGKLHPVATQLFIPFAVTRLQERPEDTETVLTVALRGVVEGITEDRPLRLLWERSSIPTLPLAVQDHALADGYVVVVGFAARRAIVSFHRSDRSAP